MPLPLKLPRADYVGNGGTAALPAGAIVPWFTRDGVVPEGWALCDGTRGTPDLRGRFLIGARSVEDVGVEVGSARHSHSYSGLTSDARYHSDAWGFPPGIQALRNGAPQMTGSDHGHGFQGTTTEAAHLPPCTAVLFIMKL